MLIKIISSVITDWHDLVYKMWIAITRDNKLTVSETLAHISALLEGL